MNKYQDTTLVRANRLNLRLTDEELTLLRQYQQLTRAPSLSVAVRQAAIQQAKRCQNGAKIGTEIKENKERSKENKELSNPLGVDSPARPRDLNFFVSKITTDEALRPLAAEFIRGQMATGVDLERKTDLREHFNNWLPKYQAKMQIAAKNSRTQREQNFIKHEREAKAAEQLRKITEQHAAANTAEAQAARAKVLAKFTKWRSETDAPKNVQ